MDTEYDDEANGQRGNMPPQQRETLRLTGRTGETEAQVSARVLLESDVNAALTIHRVAPPVLGIEITPLLDELAKQSVAVELKRGEAMLANQAATLDALFHTMARRAMANIESNVGVADTYMRLALRAQSQSRSNWEALGELRHPRAVAFIKQQNVARGHQQVINNARGENESPPNELNEAGHAMDTRGTTPAIRVGPAMATVGPIDGAAIKRGQGEGLAERLQGKRAQSAAPGRKAAKRKPGRRS